MALGKLIDTDRLGDFLGEIRSRFAAKSDAISHITRSGVTFTARRADGTTFTFSQRDTSYQDATQGTHGLMSVADKQKLDGIDEGANAYALPTMTSTMRGGAKLGTGLSVENDTLNLSATVRYAVDANGNLTITIE